MDFNKAKVEIGNAKTKPPKLEAHIFFKTEC